MINPKVVIALIIFLIKYDIQFSFQKVYMTHL